MEDLQEVVGAAAAVVAGDPRGALAPGAKAVFRFCGDAQSTVLIPTSSLNERACFAQSKIQSNPLLIHKLGNSSGEGWLVGGSSAWSLPYRLAKRTDPLAKSTGHIRVV